MKRTFEEVSEENKKRQKVESSENIIESADVSNDGQEDAECSTCTQDAEGGGAETVFENESGIIDVNEEDIDSLGFPEIKENLDGNENQSRRDEEKKGDKNDELDENTSKDTESSFHDDFGGHNPVQDE